jgi:DNA helicase-2/ATP-dependent DNA helicase PcrA
VASLTREQQAAVRSRAHALVLHAGAGSGKTLTLAHRVAALAPGPREQARTLVLTFTRDACASLQRKLALVLSRHHLVRVLTFHQWAARELPREERDFLDEREQRRILEDVVRRDATIARRLGDDPAARLAAAIGCAKSRERPIDAALAPLAEAYETRKGERLDYDDVPLRFRDHLRRRAFRAEVAARLDHVLVDEFQDVSAAQAESVQRVTLHGPRVTVVGDPRQSIYAFRGASPEHLGRFAEAYGRRAEVRALTANFRATRRLVAAANAVEPGLAPMRPARRARLGCAPRLLGFPDGAREAEGAARLVEAWDPRECVVLVRARHLAAAFLDAWRRRGHEDPPPVRTIHAAKGLEWERVLLLGAREGALPDARAAADEEALAEERRLLYVALTRARREFVATWAGPRPSRFLACL